MKSHHLKLVLIIACILYGIYIWKVIESDKEFIIRRLNERFFRRALPEYAMLSALLLLIGHAAYHEKDGIVKRTYVGLISLALASAVTSLSAHIKLLTLPAFTVLFFWALTHSFL